MKFKNEISGATVFFAILSVIFFIMFLTSNKSVLSLTDELSSTKETMKYAVDDYKKGTYDRAYELCMIAFGHDEDSANCKEIAGSLSMRDSEGITWNTGKGMFENILRLRRGDVKY